MCSSYFTQRKKSRGQFKELVHWLHHRVYFICYYWLTWVLRHDGHFIQQLFHKGDAYRAFRIDQLELLGYVLVLISASICRKTCHLYASLFDLSNVEPILTHALAQLTLPQSWGQLERPRCGESTYHYYPALFRHSLLRNRHHTGVHWGLLWLRNYLLLTSDVLP